MKKLYIDNRERFIVYNKQISSENKAPCVIFLHGFMSDMNGSKALAAEKYCKSKGYGFIRFDNFGCGESSGKFTDQTMTDWLSGLNSVINELADGPILLIGSSMGGWLALLATKLHKEKIIGIITIAAAVDFTESLIWNKLTEIEKRALKEKGICEVSGSNNGCTTAYPISYKLIEDGRKHLTLGKEKIEVSCPVHLIHGMQDFDVPYSISLETAKKVQSEKVVIKLIKDAAHKLAREQDLRVLYNSIDEILQI